eukprot:1166263-Rhodomonas_salina.1
MVGARSSLSLRVRVLGPNSSVHVTLYTWTPRSGWLSHICNQSSQPLSPSRVQHVAASVTVSRPPSTPRVAQSESRPTGKPRAVAASLMPSTPWPKGWVVLRQCHARHTVSGGHVARFMDTPSRA